MEYHIISKLVFAGRVPMALIAGILSSTISHTRPVCSTPRHFLKQQRKSMFNALLYKKHPLLYRQKIQSAPPWHYYGMLGALIACVFALMKKKHSFAFVIVCVWMFLLARFCLHRLSDTSRSPSHVSEMFITSLLIPPLAIYWRIRGAIKYRVFFL